LVRAAGAVERLGVVVVVDLVAALLVVDRLAVVVLVVEGAVAPGAAVSAAAAPVSVEAAAVVVVVVAWRAMPRPRALATPMLSEAKRARLRAAGWGRFGLMGGNVRTGRECSVRGR
jgi:hypothetical protein